MVECLFEVANQHNRTMTIKDQRMLQVQRQEKLRRQDLKKQEGLEKAEKKLIDARLWAEKYDRLAWKNSREVTMKLRKIIGSANKMKELKFQINIRVKGFGFNKFPCSFSSGGKQKSVEELTALLKNITREMQGTLFEWPELELPERKVLPIVGALAPDAVQYDSRQRSMKEDITNQALERRYQQELSGDTDNFANLQPAAAPEPSIGMRIDMLFNYADDEDDSDILMWSQGVIQIISNGSSVPKERGGFHKKGDAVVLWDACADRNEEASRSVASIPKNLFNKHVQNSWRLDVTLQLLFI